MFRKSFRSKPKNSAFNRGNNFKKNFSHQNKRQHRGQHIDVSQFINKVSVVAEVKEYIPHYRFQDFQIDERLKKNIIQKGYVQPTPIQDKAIVQILDGKDVVGIANTGTGKTAAFLIPLIQKVLLNPKEKVLIMVPTRELALQIQDEFVAFSKFLNIFSALCIGGASIRNQIFSLKKSHNFVIGTPGRLKDLIQRKFLNLSFFRNVVLDEADRMVDMGFIQDIKLLLGQMPRQRQSLFFSATISPQIAELIKVFLQDPITISVKFRETASNVDQDVVRVPNKDQKIEILHELLIKAGFSKVLIFGRTKHGVEKLSVSLAKRGFKVASIHGNKTQFKRQSALNLFKDNRIQVLVATDVAARGLDIPNVSHVINYDVPSTYDDYIHRIGRTGRANNKGTALTFVD